MTAVYRIADRNVRIVSLCDEVHRLCRDYRAEGEPDYTVETSPADLDRERKGAGASKEDGYLETLAVYRKIAEAMPRWNTILIHGSALAFDGEACLFAAPSGTGKSTHARLWREVFGERAVMVNDDKPLVRISEEGAVVYGTPWNGKHRLGSNIAVPLRDICFLERAAINRIRPIGKAEARSALLQQIYRPSDPAMLAETLRLADLLAEKTLFWRLGCNMEREAAEVACSAMRGGGKTAAEA